MCYALKWQCFAHEKVLGELLALHSAAAGGRDAEVGVQQTGDGLICIKPNSIELLNEFGQTALGLFFQKCFGSNSIRRSVGPQIVDTIWRGWPESADLRPNAPPDRPGTKS